MNNEEKRRVCPRCNGSGGKFVFSKGKGNKKSKTSIEMKQVCPTCWGSGHLDPGFIEVPQDQQGTRYLQYP